MRGDSESGWEKAVQFFPVLGGRLLWSLQHRGRVWLCRGLPETPLFPGASCCLWGAVCTPWEVRVRPQTTSLSPGPAS